MAIEQNTHTFTKEEMHTATNERVEEISKEFSAGFKFLEKYPTSVTFFGSSLVTSDNPYYQSAEALAGKITKELNYSVISGGGPGIMEAANKGAFDAGGKSLGLTIKLPDGQVTNKYLTDKIDLYYFFVRKMCMSFSAEAFIFFPGGLGTLDEFFEMMTLVQTKKIVGVPLICVGSDYWKSVEQFIEQTLLSRGMILPADMDLFTITDDHDKIIDIIRKSPTRDSFQELPRI